MVWFCSAMACIGFRAVGGWFPLRKSSTLSPDSIQRRVYWSGCAAGLLLLFIGQLPDWRAATFITAAMGLGVVATAVQFTNHLRIRGRTYAAFPKPDRPPALAPYTDEQ